jgi:hypothetical protein
MVFIPEIINNVEHFVPQRGNIMEQISGGKKYMLKFND